MGLISRRMAVAQLGYDVAQVDAEIAADRQRESDLGLSFGPKAQEQNGIKTETEDDHDEQQTPDGKPG